MKKTTLNLIAVFTATLMVVIFFTGCKKDNPVPDTSEPSLIPQSAMFISTYDNSKGTTIYILDALTGSLATQYTYPAQPQINWVHPVAGNGFLYSLDNKNIRAINMNTGEVSWTYPVENAVVPILHENVFFGVYKNDKSYGVYSLDATKSSANAIWNYPLSKPPTDLRYFNGLLYVRTNNGLITVLDIKTGIKKWEVSAQSNALIALSEGVIIDGDNIIDAGTGTLKATATMPVTPLTYGTDTRSYSTLEYATNNLYFVRTNQYNSTPGIYTPYLTAMPHNGATNKWQITYNGGFTPNFTVENRFYRVWNDKLIMVTLSSEGSRYGPTISENYWIMDINTGERKLTFEDTGKGATVSSYISGSIMYFNKQRPSKSASPYPPEPAINYLFAIDLNTGKQKWNNDELLKNYSGQTSNCVYTFAKGYSPYIQ